MDEMKHITMTTLDKDKVYYQKHPMSGYSDKLAYSEELGWLMTRVSTDEVPDNYNPIWA